VIQDHFSQVLELGAERAPLIVREVRFRDEYLRQATDAEKPDAEAILVHTASPAWSECLPMF